MDLVLSLFPGADLLGRGFEAEGFCVARGPDEVWGGDIRSFHPPAGKFAGVIGGPPCQKFSIANPNRDPAAGMDLVREYIRCVLEAGVDWFLMENTPGVPRIEVPGYSIQCFFLNATECGGRQRRNRCFQFGSRDAAVIVCDRKVTPEGPLERTCLATEGNNPRRVSWHRVTHRRTWADFCELQGLPRDFDLPGTRLAAKYKAVGNGVPVYMARVIARAVLNRRSSHTVTLCRCGCGRAITGNQRMAEASCRKRMQRERDRAALGVAGNVTT